jgi:hypothetical protein
LFVLFQAQRQRLNNADKALTQNAFKTLLGGAKFAIIHFGGRNTRFAGGNDG